MKELIGVLYQEAFDAAYDEMKENNPARYYSERLPEQHHINEKFAELIIQECIDACIEADGIKYITPPSQGQVVFDCVREIKQRWS